MADRPIVHIPSLRRGSRHIPPGGGGSRQVRFPDAARQRQRIGPRITELEQYLARSAAQLSESAAGAAPEEVIVFDIAGSVDDFVTAARRIPGMEWLVESDEFDGEVDEDFGPRDSGRDTYSSRLYLVLANHQALQQLIVLWQYHQAVEDGSQDSWPNGQAPWGRVFRYLKDLRLWGPEDRLQDTGLIEDWQARREMGIDHFPVEIELWFRDHSIRRVAAEETIRRSVAEAGGEVLSANALPEIGYHALLARFGSETADRLLNREEVALLVSGSVMLLRPAGQFAVTPIPQGPVDLSIASSGTPLPQDVPRVALLDGAPLSQHALLEGRVIVSDPDEFGQSYRAGERRHGTAMSSAIIHGDLSVGGAPLSSPLLVRPIMHPDPTSLGREESMPTDMLAVDLVHRAVREIVDAEVRNGPVAPSVRLINLSVCIPNRPLEQVMSPMARLLDWLSWTFNILFVVSAGNHPDPIIVDVPRDEFRNLPEHAKNQAVTAALWRSARLRKILSPADSVNAITVASTHEDGSQEVSIRSESFFESEVFPSPLNPLGLGYGRSVKPDVLAPGGRQPYRLSPLAKDGGRGLLEAVPEGLPPGVLVADGGATGGNFAQTSYTRGSSNAAAAVTRLGAKVLGVLQTGDHGIDDEYHAVVTKCLLGHSATWGPSKELIADTIAPDKDRRLKRIATTRFLGFGSVAEGRATTATDERVTAIGWSRLARDQTDTYELPLPPSMSGKQVLKRLTVTLAWFTPINPADRRYRQAKLWVETIDHGEKLLGVSRTQGEYNMVRRGTLQHETYEGASAAAFVDGDVLSFLVSCKEDAGGLGDAAVRYGLAISLEIAQPVQSSLWNPLTLYDEVVTRLRAAVRVGIAN